MNLYAIQLVKMQKMDTEEITMGNNADKILFDNNSRVAPLGLLAMAVNLWIRRKK